MKKTLSLISVPLMVLALAGCTYGHDRDVPPGHYEHESSSVDSNGTAHEVDRTTDVQYDADGNRIESHKTKATTDPKGLFNKSTTTTTDTETDDAR